MSHAEAQAKQAAIQFRQKHRLGIQPLGDLAELIETTTGCDVAVLDAEDGEHGLTMLDPARDAVYIAVARTRNPMRQRSTLAHELGHMLFQDWADPASSHNSFQETRATAFARHLLLPEAGVKQLLGHRTTVTESDLSTVVHRFLVSPQIAAIVLRDTGYITPRRAEVWKQTSTPNLATRYGWTDHYASLQADSNKMRAPQKLLTRAITGYIEGVVSAQTIATLRGISTDAVLQDLEQAGITPHPPTPTDMSATDLPHVDVDLSGLDDGETPRDLRATGP